MRGIRPCTPEDLPAVASLFERVSRSGSRTPAPGLTEYFRRVLFESPWSDPEIPSLVYESDGRVVSFIGLHVRRILFDDRPLRMAYTANLASDPDARGRPGGALLLRQALAGAQDLTVSSAAPHVTRMWESLGGTAVPLSSVGWIAVFHPARVLGERILRGASRASWMRRADPLLSSVDRFGERTLGDRWPGMLPRGEEQPARQTRSEPLTPQAVLDHLPRLAAGTRVRPDYDEPYLTWLFSEMQRVTARGALTARLVRDGDDQVLGWFVAYLHPQQASNLLQVIASPEGVDAVVDELFAEARRSGTPMLGGRLEPLLFRPIWERGCRVWWGLRDLVHARDGELVNAVLLGTSLLMPIDGEAWMGQTVTPVPGAGAPEASPRDHASP